MSDPLILALDLARVTGWALGRVYDRTPQSGAIVLTRPAASAGLLLRQYRYWLIEMMGKHRPDVIVFESPMLPMHMSGRTNATTIRNLIGLCAVTEESTYQTGIDVREARVADVRRHFLGSVRIKRTAAKAMTIAACRRLGWEPKDDNAADALALWHYQASIFEPKLSMQTAPLFRRGA